MMKKALLGHDAEEGEGGLRINEAYARRFEERKRKEEMGQLADKYKARLQKKGILEKVQQRQKDAEEKGSRAGGVKSGVLRGAEDAEESAASSASSGSESPGSSEYDSESDAVEDDFGTQATPAVDAQILKTLAEIRGKSSSVYSKDVDFFAPEQIARLEAEWQRKHGASRPAPKAAEPVVTLKDYHRERLLSGRAGESESEEDEAEGAGVVAGSHAQEQEELKEAMRQAFHGDDEDGDGEGDGLLRTRPRTEAELEREEKEYRQFLLENLATAANAKDSMLDWLAYRAEEEAAAQNAPARKPQLSTDDEFLMDFILNRGWMDRRAHVDADADAEEDADAEALERAEDFEAAHNFRYEQPGGTAIATYARSVPGSLRREEEPRRKRQREAAATRAEERAVRRAEELKRLKNLQGQQLAAQLQRLERCAGVRVRDAPATQAALADALGGAFDPDAHDRLVAQLAEAADSDADGKPVFSSDSELDAEPVAHVDTRPVRKATRALKRAGPAQLDALYQLDHEDVIAGDLPCRFRYQRVEPAAYGISVADILAADDAALNRHVALRKLAPYRPADVQRRDARRYASSAHVRLFRAQLNNAPAPPDH